MNKKLNFIKTEKITIYFAIILATLFMCANPCFALEADYPVMPGLPTITGTSELGDYIAYFFGIGVILAGALAVVVLTIGAIKLMISAGNPTKRKDATDMIKGAILGMVLVVSSFMILRTINLQLVTPSLTPLPEVEGIYYTNGTDKKPAPMAEANTANAPEGYNKILYDCSSGPSLFIWKFPQKNFEGIDSAWVETIDCGQTNSISGIGSFKMAFRTPGVYYFLGENCSGYMSQAQVGSGKLPEEFKNKVKSIKIVNDISNNTRYGVIFHGKSYLYDCHIDGETCMIDYDRETCQRFPECDIGEFEEKFPSFYRTVCPPLPEECSESRPECYIPANCGEPSYCDDDPESCDTDPLLCDDDPESCFYNPELCDDPESCDVDPLLCDDDPLYCNDPKAGVCSWPIFIEDVTTEEDCFNDIFVSSYATIFNWNPVTYKMSGSGVEFYQKPWGNRTGAISTSVQGFSYNAIRNFWFNRRSNAYDGSLFIDGNYIVALYDQSKRCEIFFKDVPNFKKTSFYNSSDEINFIFIAPTK